MISLGIDKNLIIIVLNLTTFNTKTNKKPKINKRKTDN